MENKKILVISDLHLTVNFIQKKFEFLKKIISDSDRVIINGDFWSGYYNSFDEFLESPWKGLFSLLKKRRCVYVYGNHDRDRWCDKRVEIFSDCQGAKYEFNCGAKIFLVAEHGHTILGDSVSTDEFIGFWRTFKIDALKYFFESLFLRIFGRYLYLPAKLFNKKIKEKSRLMKNIDFLIVGHTHWAEIDSENKFINCGLIHAGVASYLVLENCKPKIINTRY